MEASCFGYLRLNGGKMLRRPVESLQTLEYQKPTRYHADIRVKGGGTPTKHYSAYSSKTAKEYFESFGKVILFWWDKQ